MSTYQHRCPTCRKKFAADKESPCFPFCSERCKMVDLGHWLNDDYAIVGPEIALPEQDHRADPDAPSH